MKVSELKEDLKKVKENISKIKELPDDKRSYEDVKRDEKVEKLAEQIHDRWVSLSYIMIMNWLDKFVNLCEDSVDTQLVENEDIKDFLNELTKEIQFQKKCWIPYNELSEEEKEKNREIAVRYIQLILNE